MADIIHFRAPHSRPPRRSDTPIERYSRAHLNWRLNPTRGTEIERLDALLAVLKEREQSK